MKTYVVGLTSSGFLTQIPDSQKLFGALICLFSEEFGAEKATTLVQDILHKKIHVALSNVLPQGYLPTPQEYLVDRVSESSTQESDLKKKRNAIKKRKYIKPAELSKLMERPLDSKELLAGEKILPYVKLTDRQQLRVSIESERYDIPGLDNRLYSVPYVLPVEIASKQIQDGEERGEERGKVIKEFCFYLQVDNSGLGSDLVNMIQSAATKKRVLILGKRASQGLNTFTIHSCQTQEFNRDGVYQFLNTGMLLPKQIDFMASTLKLFTSQRRPFEIVGGWVKNFSKQYISFIQEGSVIFTPQGINNPVKSAVKSVESPFDPKRDIVFGNAFLYPMPLSEGSN